ncbi:MAG: MATE family efflux transporter [Bacteroidales bacterium]|jgi:putative MATE family efflux protein|nr:MATE family efflux transporter [Bacteroidales bacterium]MDD5284111.1 MATE family efflux transporter [Bacteroidales bacterium]NLN36649.1 MATE family efflux transporter [Bacteroidales bacterium]
MGHLNRDLTGGNIGKQLISLTWPMLFGMLGMVIFNLVDTYFLGKMGVKPLAAIGFVFPVIMFLNGISQGIGIGTSSLISRNVIAAGKEQVRTMATSALILGVLVVIVFAAAGLLTIRPLFTFLGAGEDILEYIYDYMSVWYLGLPFVVLPMVGNNIVRATGDTFTPGMIMLTSAVINTILDPLLIFGYGPFPQMGVKGAALATVIGRSVSMVIILIILIKREKIITLHPGSLKKIAGVWKKVFYIAGPATLGLLITPLSLAVITRIVSSYGKEAVAAFGVASRVEMFALMVISALGSVMIIFMGQNISRNQFSRILKALSYASRFSVSWGGLVFVLLLLLAVPIASVFTNDQQVISIARQYFLIIGASYGFQGLVMLSTAAYNGINKPYPSVFFITIRTMGLFVPLALLGSALIGLNGVMWAGFTANILVGIASYTFLRRMVGKIRDS